MNSPEENSERVGDEKGEADVQGEPLSVLFLLNFAVPVRTEEFRDTQEQGKKEIRISFLDFNFPGPG